MLFAKLFAKKPGKRTGGHMKPGQRVEFQPTVVYNPNKKNVNRSGLIKTNRKQVKWKPIIAALLGLALIGAVFFGIRLLMNSESLAIKHYELLGNRTINNTQVLAVLSKYTNKNIIFTDADVIEADLKNEFKIFNGVRVIKCFPNTLEVRISEREPKLVYVDLSGAFLVDGDGRVLQQIYLDPLVVPVEKMNIARGYGDISSDYLKQIFIDEYIVNNKLLDLPVTEKDAAVASGFKYEQIDIKTRQARLLSLEKTYSQEFYQVWDAINQIVDSGEYSTYKRVDAIDDKVYTGEVNVDLDRLDLTSDLETLFTSKNIVVNRIIWEGELLVKFNTADDKQLVFSTERKVSDQFEDYLLVLNELQKEGKNYCQIDLSATKIAVKACK